MANNRIYTKYGNDVRLFSFF